MASSICGPLVSSFLIGAGTYMKQKDTRGASQYKRLPQLLRGLKCRANEKNFGGGSRTFRLDRLVSGPLRLRTTTALRDLDADGNGISVPNSLTWRERAAEA
jgi:hypothetical protein